MFGRKSSDPQIDTASASVSNEEAQTKLKQETVGSATPVVTEKLSADGAKQRSIATPQLSELFAQIVSVLMRSPAHKHFSLADLEWLVVPPLLAGQCAVVEAKARPDGPGVPVGIVIWASVAPEVDRRLSENVNAPIRLRPDEWKSGDILWVVEAIGDSNAMPPLLKQLNETTFKSRQVKLRVLGKDNKPSVGTLQQIIGARPQPNGL